jgi:invasion protein IalB
LRFRHGRRAAADFSVFDRRASTVFRPFLPLIVLLLSLPSPALAQGEVRGVYGDWHLRCDTPPGAQHEQCVIMQFVTAEDRENVGISVVVLKTADKQAHILRVLAPLGVLLTKGLGLMIDGEDMGSASFVKCVTNGCFAEVLLDPTLVEKLRTGEQAMFIIFQTPEEGIGVPISLSGFGEGYDALP